MTLEVILAVVSGVLGVLDVYLYVNQWNEKSRIKAKEEIWNEDARSIIRVATNMMKRIDDNKIQDVKEVRNVFMSIGEHARGIHEGMEKELRTKDQ